MVVCAGALIDNGQLGVAGSWLRDGWKWSS